MPIKRLTAFLLTATLSACCGCRPQGAGAPAGADEPVKLAFITNNATDFWKIAEVGVNQANEEFNAECIMRLPGQATAAEQKAIIEDLLAKGVAGIAISCIHPGSQTPFLNEVAKTAKVITQDSDAADSDRICFIGTDNYKAGLRAGEALKKALPAGGKVWVFVGKKDQQNAVDRFRGLKDAIAGSRIQIMDLRTDDADLSRAKANAEDVLAKHGDVAAMVGLWAYNAPAIIEAVKAAKKEGQIQIVGFDEFPATLQGIKDGYIYGTIVQQPYKFGYESVRVLAALVRGDNAVVPENEILDIPTRLITKENVDAFWSDLKKLMGQS